MAFSPKDLTNAISMAHGRNEETCEISVGRQGDWFLRTQKNYVNIVYLNPAKAYDTIEAMKRNGAPYSVNDLLTVTFYKYGFFVSILQANCNVGHFWDTLPESLDNYLTGFGGRGVRSVSIDVDDSWVVVLNNGSYAMMGVVQELKSALAKETPASVILSPHSQHEYFINYTSGSYYFNLPADWKPVVT